MCVYIYIYSARDEGTALINREEHLAEEDA